LGQARKLSQLQVEDLELEDANFLSALKSVEAVVMNRCRIRTLQLDNSVALLALEIRSGTIEELTARRCPRLGQMAIWQSKVGRLTVDSCPRFFYLSCGYKTQFDRVHLSDLPALTSITMQEGNAPGKLTLRNLSALNKVQFWAAKVQKQHIEALAGLPALRELDISLTPLGDEAAAAIAELKTLERLSVSFHFTKKGLKMLARLPALRKLYLYHRDHSDWTPEEARRIFSHVKDVTVF
jgi:hypothetical protein